jgi:hypothetical protein
VRLLAGCLSTTKLTNPPYVLVAEAPFFSFQAQREH